MLPQLFCLEVCPGTMARDHAGSPQFWAESVDFGGGLHLQSLIHIDSYGEKGLS